jgi:APA family basic amino acid/polyamine antiporter
MQMPEISGAADQLRPELNVWHATAIVIGSILGSGIFLVSAEMMQATGSPLVMLLVWLLGTTLAIFGSLTVSELGSRRPFTGGAYVFIRDAYGELPAFLSVWTAYIIVGPACMATISAGLIRSLSFFDPHGLLSSTAFTLNLAFSTFNFTCGQLLSVSILVFFAIINYFGVRRAGNLQLVLSSLKLLLLVTVIVIVLKAPTASATHFSEHLSGARGGLSGFMAALIAVMWAYNGWEGVVVLGGEIRNSKRVIPISILSGVSLVALLYFGFNLAVQYALPVQTLAHSKAPGVTAAALTLGTKGGAIVSAIMAFSMFGTLSGGPLAGPRAAYAVSEDGYFKFLSHVNKRYHTPTYALAMQTALSSYLILFGGAFSNLFTLVISVSWTWHIVSMSTIFVFRHREPAGDDVFKAWGYPFTPIFFIFTALVMLYATIENFPRQYVYSLGTILAGLPVYCFAKHRRELTLQLSERNRIIAEDNVTADAAEA